MIVFSPVGALSDSNLSGPMHHVRNRCDRNPYVPRVSSDRDAFHHKRPMRALRLVALEGPSWCYRANSGTRVLSRSRWCESNPDLTGADGQEPLSGRVTCDVIWQFPLRHLGLALDGTRLYSEPAWSRSPAGQIRCGPIPLARRRWLHRRSSPSRVRRAPGSGRHRAPASRRRFRAGFAAHRTAASA